MIHSCSKIIHSMISCVVSAPSVTSRSSVFTRGRRARCRRITPGLVDLLKRYHPLYLNTQFNHPDEITLQASAACSPLADAGIPLGCQTVVLKGVNDSAVTMQHLLRSLLKVRVKPYYLHHADPVKGTSHLRTSFACGRSIMKTLRANMSGLAVPQYAFGLPRGGGKVPVPSTGFPEYE